MYNSYQGQRIAYPKAAILSPGVAHKRFDVITPIIESNAVLNLCKMKTHLFTGMTGAVKNIFEVTLGLSKPGYHAKLQDLKHFSAMLLDLANCISPRLSIMDAVLAIEDDGPGAGNTKSIGLRIGSVNPLALDIVASEIIDLVRKQNPIILQAEKWSLCPSGLKKLKFSGQI